MFESTIDSPSPSFSLSLSLPYPEHPIPVSNGELSRRTVLIPGAIVQLGINPPVVPDCCKRSFLLRSYINRLRSAAKRDPTSSSLDSAKTVRRPLFLLPRIPIASGTVVKFGGYHSREGRPASRDSAESSQSISEWPYISARLLPPSLPFLSTPLSYFRERSR